MAANPTLTELIQIFLKKQGAYSGKIDGKFGPQTLVATKVQLARNGNKFAGWSTPRLKVAAEQMFYDNEDIEVGSIDGFVGPTTLQARAEWEARAVSNWRNIAEVVAAEKPPVKTASVSLNATQWPTQDRVSAYFGKVGQRQDTCTVPFPLRVAWDKGSKLTKYSCHELVAPAMTRIWQKTLDHYGHEQIKELGIDLFGGCLNVRKMRGGSAWSMHSWGIAIDIDPDRNALRTTWKNAQLSKPAYKKFVQFWYDEGAINLGIERDYDAMHFQFARLK